MGSFLSREQWINYSVVRHCMKNKVFSWRNNVIITESALGYQGSMIMDCLCRDRCNKSEGATPIHNPAKAVIFKTIERRLYREDVMYHVHCIICSVSKNFLIMKMEDELII